MGGTWYGFGTGLADVITRYSEGVRATAEVTAGSLENYLLLKDGNVEICFLSANVAYGAYKGTGGFEHVEAVRGLFMANGQPMHILVNEDSNINTVADLRGKTVSAGPAGSGGNLMLLNICEVYGIDPDQDINRIYLSNQEQVMALADRHIDAAIYLIGIPNSSIAEFCFSHNARFIPSFEEEYIDIINEKYPFYTKTEIPANTYKGQSEAVPSLGVFALVVTHKDVSEDIAYEVTKAVIENISEVAEIHSVAKEMSFEVALEGMPIPLHPGAEKYFREKNHPKFK